MKSFKAQKAYLVFMVLMSVLISSSLVYGDSGKPGEAVSLEVFYDGAGMTNQGIITLANGMSCTATASTLVNGCNDTGAALSETPSTIRTANGKIRTAKTQSASDGCKESCSLN